MNTLGIEMIEQEQGRLYCAKDVRNHGNDQYSDGALIIAALAYATLAAMQLDRDDAHTLLASPPYTAYGWPAALAWKPADSPRHNLAKAGALIATELNRLARFPLPGGAA